MSDKKDEGESIPFYPDHVRTEFIVTLGILAILVLIAIAGLFYPVGSGDPADPLNTPQHVKPEWYFLALHQLLKFIPKTTGAVAPVIAIIILVLWPFIDRKPDKSTKTYWGRFIFVAIAIIILAALTIWGEVT